MIRHCVRSSRLAAFVILVAVSVVSAVDSVWIGGATGSWTDAANWSDGVPQAASDTATFNTPAVVTIPASITLKTIFANAPATVTVAAGATLALSNGGGDILVASADFTLDGAGEVTISRTGIHHRFCEYQSQRPAPPSRSPPASPAWRVRASS